jgi:ATP synthase protein I
MNTKLSEKKRYLEINGEYRVVDKKEKDNPDEKRFISGMGLAADLGLMIALPLVGGAFLGSYLDKKFDTTPRATLSLIFFGLLFSIYSVYKMLKDLK